MKRFVDLEEALEQPCFAFFDTVTGTFDTWCGTQHWENLDDLADDMYAKAGTAVEYLEADELVFRYKSLLPARYGGSLP